MASTNSSHHTTPIPQASNATYLPTAEAYDRWAASYDTDSNPLQALDDLQLQTLLPRFISIVLSERRRTTSHPSVLLSGETINVVDLGCGTGRNTAKLLHLLPARSHLTGLDASPNMLSIARSRCDAALQSLDTPHAELTFHSFDIFHPPALPLSQAQAMISTLTIEHIPLTPFFSAASSLLQPGGLFFLTNMHPGMGSISQAGFTDPATGAKVRPVSYAHGLADTVEEAQRWGLKVVDLGPPEEAKGQVNRSEEKGSVDGTIKGVMEAEITEDLVARGLVGNRAAKWVGVRCWFGVVFRKN